MAEKYVLAIDQGTTSSRAIVFNHEGRIVGSGQKEHEQIFPKAGWVEHNAIEIWDNIREVVGVALAHAQVNKESLVAVGVTNQRKRFLHRPHRPAVVLHQMRRQELKRMQRVNELVLHSRELPDRILERRVLRRQLGRHDVLWVRLETVVFAALDRCLFVHCRGLHFGHR